MRRWMLLLLICLLGLPRFAQAQGGTFDVFVREEGDQLSLQFLDARSGLGVLIPIGGERFTLIGNGVLFRAAESRAAQIAYPDGRVVLHPQIPAENENTRADWVVSANKQWLAWTLTTRSARGTVSDLFLSQGEGEGLLVLHTSSTQNLALLPVGVSDDGAQIFYIRRKNVFDEPRPLQSLPVQGIMRFDVASAAAVPVADPPGCPCVAAIAPHGGTILRLVPSAAGGFAANFSDASGLTIRQSEPLDTRAVLGGNIRFTPDGRRALYLLSSGGDRPRYVLGLANQGIEQGQVVLDPAPELLEVVHFTDDGEAAIILGLESGTTYKVALADGTLSRISSDLYLGTLP